MRTLVLLLVCLAIVSLIVFSDHTGAAERSGALRRAWLIELARSRIVQTEMPIGPGERAGERVVDLDAQTRQPLSPDEASQRLSGTN
jgi:hypothetical protein